MGLRSRFSGFSGCFLFLALARPMFECHAQNITETSTSNGNSSEIDFEALSLFGVSHEFAEEFRINLIKAIEVVKEEGEPPLRQAGGAANGGGTEEEGEDEEEQAPTTQGPGAFGILSGIFGIFSGFGTLNPSRIVQSTVNFFPPSRRMMAQMIVDSIIGYVPPENRTSRPRPRTRKPGSTTEMVITDAMLKDVTNSSMSTTNTSSGVIPKDGENSGTGMGQMGPVNGTDDSAAMSEVIAAPTTTAATTTEAAAFINLHELLARSTTPPPAQEEDDEDDVVKRVYYGTNKQMSNSSISIYKIKVKAPNEDIETRGLAEEETTLTNLNYTASTMPTALPAAEL